MPLKIKMNEITDAHISKLKTFFRERSDYFGLSVFEDDGKIKAEVKTTFHNSEQIDKLIKKDMNPKNKL